jgi:hypothetical protein
VQAAAPLRRTALLTLNWAQPDPNRASTVAAAVRAAETRKSDIVFEIVTLLKPTATAFQQDLAVKAAQQDAAATMQLLLAQGVPAARVRLGLEMSADAAPRQVRVYVR